MTEVFAERRFFSLLYYLQGFLLHLLASKEGELSKNRKERAIIHTYWATAIHFLTTYLPSVDID